MPTVTMRDENGTEIAQGNSTVSYTVSYTTEDDFGTFNCTAKSPFGMAQHLVELRKAGTHLTNRFHVAVHLSSNRSQMTSKCGKNKKVAHEAIAECVTDVLTTF